MACCLIEKINVQTRYIHQDDSYRMENFQNGKFTRPQYKEKNDKETRSESKWCSSLIRFHGEIIPPLLAEPQREEMLMYKEEAMQLQKSKQPLGQRMSKIQSLFDSVQPRKVKTLEEFILDDSNTTVKQSANGVSWFQTSKVEGIVVRRWDPPLSFFPSDNPRNKGKVEDLSRDRPTYTACVACSTKLSSDPYSAMGAGQLTDHSSESSADQRMTSSQTPDSHSNTGHQSMSSGYVTNDNIEVTCHTSGMVELGPLSSDGGQAARIKLFPQEATHRSTRLPVFTDDHTDAALGESLQASQPRVRPGEQGRPEESNDLDLNEVPYRMSLQDLLKKSQDYWQQQQQLRAARLRAGREVEDDSYRMENFQNGKFARHQYKDKNDKETRSDSKWCLSLIHFHGVNILPPLLAEPQREEMLMYKEEAMQLQKSKPLDQRMSKIQSLPDSVQVPYRMSLQDLLNKSQDYRRQQQQQLRAARLRTGREVKDLSDNNEFPGTGQAEMGKIKEKTANQGRVQFFLETSHVDQTLRSPLRTQLTDKAKCSENLEEREKVFDYSEDKGQAELSNITTHSKLIDDHSGFTHSSSSLAQSFHLFKGKKSDSGLLRLPSVNKKFGTIPRPKICTSPTHFVRKSGPSRKILVNTALDVGNKVRTQPCTGWHYDPMEGTVRQVAKMESVLDETPVDDEASEEASLEGVPAANIPGDIVACMSPVQREPRCCITPVAQKLRVPEALCSTTGQGLGSSKVFSDVSDRPVKGERISHGLLLTPERAGHRLESHAKRKVQEVQAVVDKLHSSTPKGFPAVLVGVPAAPDSRESGG